MATKYVTLKDSDGNTLYPQAVASVISSNSVGTSSIADGAVTAVKIAPSVLQYQPGESFTIASGDNTYYAGRTRTQSSNKYVWFQVQLDKPVSTSVTSVSFSPTGYQEVFGPSGVILSINNPSSSELTITGYVSSYNRTIIYCTMTIKDSTSLTGNLCCSVHIGGAFKFN